MAHIADGTNKLVWLPLEWDVIVRQPFVDVLKGQVSDAFLCFQWRCLRFVYCGGG